jgi:hypothetical protein
MRGNSIFVQKEAMQPSHFAFRLREADDLGESGLAGSEFSEAWTGGLFGGFEPGGSFSV